MSITQAFSHSCQWLQAQLQQQQLPEIKRWVIALSGGLDSVATLHLANKLLPSNAICAIHVNHQLQHQADSWQQFCEQLAQKYDIPFEAFKVSVDGSSEQLLRDARYQCFVEYLKPNDCLLFGHHANDQAETMLFRLVRGAGTKGLSAMPVERELGEGRVLRPLLNISRESIAEYASREKLHWIEDPSNQSIDYDRNFLRHKVLKPLIDHWPKASEKLARSAQLVAEDHQLLNDYLMADLKSIASLHCLDLNKWQGLPEAKARALLRLWVNRGAARILSAKQLEQIIKQVIYSKVDSKAHSILGTLTIRRFKAHLYIINEAKKAVIWPKVAGTAAVYTTTQGALSVTSSNKGIELTDAMHFATAEPGMVIRATNRPAKKLKKIFLESSIPPWYREHWPLLMLGDEVVAVVGICVCEGWLKEVQNNSVFCLEWQPL